MHQAAYDALGLPWLYVPFACESVGLKAALEGMRALSIRGFGVSMPFKIEILPLLDELAPLARTIGAVNTVVNDGGRLCGHNTDAEGAVQALEEEVGSLRDARVLVIGAGGAARAVAFGVHAAGAKLLLCNRTRDKAEALAAELKGAEVVAYEEALRKPPADIIVQATSAGMAGAASLPFDEAAFSERNVVMDIVYKPLHTELIQRAKAAGAKTIHGGRMLLFQAARQFELYTGKTAPLGVMDEVIREAAAG